MESEGFLLVTEKKGGGREGRDSQPAIGKKEGKESRIFLLRLARRSREQV